MAVTIAEALRQIKSDVAHVLERKSIEAACRAAEHAWRDRVLDPATTVEAFVQQILHGNLACQHLVRLVKLPCTEEAYSKARTRLPQAVLDRVLQDVTKRCHGSVQDDGLWHGHRTYLVDGASFSMPDTLELRNYFGQPGAQKKGCGFPVAHWLALFHAGSGMLLRWVTSPMRTHDMSQVGKVHPALSAGDIEVGDRAFCSYAHLAMLQARQVHGLFRVHQRQIVVFRKGSRVANKIKQTGKAKNLKGLPSSRWLKRLGVNDQLVEYVKPKQKPKWMSTKEYARLPETLVVRELRYRIQLRNCRVYEVTLVTTLLDADKYPASALAELYRQRWDIEIIFRHLKQSLRMDVLRCKTVAGVLKELTIYGIVYNLVRLVMCVAARRQHVPVQRISFLDAVRWIASARPDEELPDLVINPLRPDRSHPRVRKRRPKQYPLMTKPRAVLKKEMEKKVQKARELP